MLVKRSRNLGTDGKITRIMVVVIKSMACYKDQLVMSHTTLHGLYVLLLFIYFLMSY